LSFLFYYFYSLFFNNIHMQNYTFLFKKSNFSTKKLLCLNSKSLCIITLDLIYKHQLVNYKL